MEQQTFQQNWQFSFLNGHDTWTRFENVFLNPFRKLSEYFGQTSKFVARGAEIDTERTKQTSSLLDNIINSL